MSLMICVFFFFKQKTAYEMRISDWSSDVCSSDLAGLFTAFGGWLLSSEAAVLIGIVMSIGGFLVNVYFKWRQQQRQIAAAAEQSRQEDRKSTRLNSSH